MAALAVQLLLPVLCLAVDCMYGFAPLLEVLRVGVVAGSHQAILVVGLPLTYHRVLLRVRRALLTRCQVYQRRPRYHVLHALLFYFFHVPLMLQHFADVFDLIYVELSSLLELLVVLDEELIVFPLGVVETLLVVELTHVHALGLLHELVPHPDLLKEMLFRLKLISFEK